jgi:H+/Cl- antiporter ClcA
MDAMDGTAPPAPRPDRRVLRFIRRAYDDIRSLARFDVAEQGRLLAHLLRWIGLGAVVGVLAGLASAGFLVTLTWATELREANPWLLAFLPLAGFGVGLAYYYGGGRSGEGNNLILDEIHQPSAWIPPHMAPLVYVGTVLTQLFGGSAGREGTAIQMAGSLTDVANRLLRLHGSDRRTMLVAAIAAGFGSVFGVPLAGCIFALEVQSVGRVRYDAIVPALTASLVGDSVVRALGVHHAPTPRLEVQVDLALLGKVAVAGLAFGLASVAFSELTHGIKAFFGRAVSWPPARPLIGGVAIIGLTVLVGDQTYNGLSLGLIASSLTTGAGVATFAFALKILFTSVTLGSGFQGGEVTPLFVIGATLGVTLGHLLGVPTDLMAAVGFVAVFAGAANTPLACTIMAAELFGAAGIPVFAVGCVVSYVFSSHRGIYLAQRVGTGKGGDAVAGVDGANITVDPALRDLSGGRRFWLPARQEDDGPTTGTS